MNKRYDLGNPTGATDIYHVNDSFNSLVNMPNIPCIYCRQPSTHKLVPISGTYPNAYEEDNAYCCTYCIRHVNRSVYSPREMK